MDAPALNGALLEAFRHDAWANRQLLDLCKRLSPEQLASSGVATYGGILETLNHIVVSDARYLRRLAGQGPEWVDSDDVVEIDELRRRVDGSHEGWTELLAEPFDAEREILLDEGAYRAHAGVLVAQALHHGNAHREQVCALLTALDLEPPDVQAWAYADATGRGGPRTPD